MPANDHIVNIPNAGQAIAATPEAAQDFQRVVDARDRFIKTYCAAKGWPADLSKLSMAQIMEIRAQPGWKNP